MGIIIKLFVRLKSRLHVILEDADVFSWIKGIRFVVCIYRSLRFFSITHVHVTSPSYPKVPTWLTVRIVDKEMEAVPGELVHRPGDHVTVILLVLSEEELKNLELAGHVDCPFALPHVYLDVTEVVQLVCAQVEWVPNRVRIRTSFNSSDAELVTASVCDPWGVTFVMVLLIELDYHRIFGQERFLVVPFLVIALSLTSSVSGQHD